MRARKTFRVFDPARDGALLLVLAADSERDVRIFLQGRGLPHAVVREVEIPDDVEVGIIADVDAAARKRQTADRAKRTGL